MGENILKNENIFSYMGRATFGKLPYVESVDKVADDVDYAVIGVPYDTSTSNRPGTRFGPRTIRQSFGSLSYNPDLKVDTNIVKGVDLGDVGIVSGYTDDSFEIITYKISQLLDKGLTPVVLGGDHAITFPELRAYANKYGKVAIVHFDSHTDTWPSKYGEGCYDHGSPFYDAIKEGLVDTEHSVQLGLRGALASKEDFDFAKNSGMELITAMELHLMGIEECAKKIREKVGDAPVLVTFDIDFLDPTFAPGTGTPEQGGFSSWEALEIIRKGLIDKNLVGFDLVEVIPLYDPGEITGLVAKRIVAEFISLLACKKAGIKTYE